MLFRFDMPIPPAANPSPYRDQARERNLEWVIENGLVASLAGRERYESWDVADSAARIFHRADADSLTGILNFYACGFLFDDQFAQGAAYRLELVCRTATELAMIPFRPPGAATEFTNPLTRAWARLWPTFMASTSRAWQERFASHFAQWMAAHAWETRLSDGGHHLNVSDYIALRCRSVGLDHSYDLVEWAYGFESPPSLMAHPLLDAMRTAATETVALMNDVHSYPRERAQHSTHNLVLTLQHQQSLTAEEALAEAIRLAQRPLARFLTLERDLPPLYEALHLTTSERVSGDHFVQGMRDWIRGNHDWALNSGRYQPYEAVAAAYEDELLNPCRD
jgi:germacradienol/geosmin synthase